MRRPSFFSLSIFMLALTGCATESTTPKVARYLQAGPAPQLGDQVEVLKGTMIQLRSGDILLEAQAQLIEDAVGVQVYLINLSDHPIDIAARQFSLTDAHGAASALLKIKDVLDPVRERAAQLEEKSKKNSGDSTDARLAKTLRGETNRLEHDLPQPFVSAVVPVNKKISAMLYFAHPAAWPVQLNVQAGDQKLAASFYKAVLNP